MKLKKVIATVAACLIAMTGFVSCAGGEDMSDIKPPVYQTGKQFMLGAWDSPMATKADYELAKDMGLTHMFVDWGGSYQQPLRGSAEFLSLLEMMSEVGVKAVLRTPPSVYDQAMAETTDYSKYSAVDIINWRDEPKIAEIPKMVAAAERHMELYPDNTPRFLVNHNPDYGLSDHDELFGDKTWEEFLEYYIEEVCSKITAGRNILSYDFYPLLSARGASAMRGQWLPSIATITALARDYDMDTHVFIQASSHFMSRPEGYPEMTEEDLRFQFAVYMAFGIQNYSYFQYCDSAANDFEEGMVERYESAKPRPLYYRAQTVNKELKALQDIYLNFSWRGTMPVHGTESENNVSDDANMSFDGLDSISFVKEATATQNALIGRFKDTNNNVDGLMVTNFTNPSDQLSNIVKIKFEDAKKVAVYTKGTERIYVLRDNVFEYTLEPGQGAFMIALT